MEEAQGVEQNKLYVGNVPYEMDDAKLGELFSGIEGVEVSEAVIITYPADESGSKRSKGFGFVTVAGADQAQKAIDALNGTEVEGRKIVVNVARPRVERSGGNGGNFRRSY